MERTNSRERLLNDKKIMKALRLHSVGSFDGIHWDDVADQIVDEYDVLVKMHAASLNYRDYGFITGAYSLVTEHLSRGRSLAN